MSASARSTRAAQHLRLVTGGRPERRAVASPPSWRVVADAIVSCSMELSRHLAEHRWGRVAEVMRERRALLAELAALDLDLEARRSHDALAAAAAESERAVAEMRAAFDRILHG